MPLQRWICRSYLSGENYYYIDFLSVSLPFLFFEFLPQSLSFPFHFFFLTFCSLRTLRLPILPYTILTHTLSLAHTHSYTLSLSLTHTLTQAANGFDDIKWEKEQDITLSKMFIPLTLILKGTYNHVLFDVIVVLVVVIIITITLSTLHPSSTKSILLLFSSISSSLPHPVPLFYRFSPSLSHILSTYHPFTHTSSLSLYHTHSLSLSLPHSSSHSLSLPVVALGAALAAIVAYKYAHDQNSRGGWRIG
jgi:hypothetical protein